MDDANAGKKGRRNTAGSDGKDNYLLGANTGKEDAAKEGLANTPWSINKVKTPSRLNPRQFSRRRLPSSSRKAAFGIDHVEVRTMLSAEQACSLVLQLPLVVIFPGQFLNDLIRQVAWGRVDRRRKAIIHNAGPTARRQRSM